MLDDTYRELFLKAGTLKNLMAELMNSLLMEDTILVRRFLGNFHCFLTTQQVLDGHFTW
jgi:hypothetical protein